MQLDSDFLAGSPNPWRQSLTARQQGATELDCQNRLISLTDKKGENQSQQIGGLSTTDSPTVPRGEVGTAFVEAPLGIVDATSGNLHEALNDAAVTVGDLNAKVAVPPRRDINAALPVQDSSYPSESSFRNQNWLLMVIRNYSPYQTQDGAPPP
jgi:hypothetical protein